METRWVVGSDESSLSGGENVADPFQKEISIKKRDTRTHAQNLLRISENTCSPSAGLKILTPERISSSSTTALLTYHARSEQRGGKVDGNVQKGLRGQGDDAEGCVVPVTRAREGDAQEEREKLLKQKPGNFTRLGRDPACRFKKPLRLRRVLITRRGEMALHQRGHGRQPGWASRELRRLNDDNSQGLHTVRFRSITRWNCGSYRQREQVGCGRRLRMRRVWREVVSAVRRPGEAASWSSECLLSARPSLPTSWLRGALEFCRPG